MRLKLPMISHRTDQVGSSSRTWQGGDCELKLGQVCAPGCLDSSTRPSLLGCFPPERLRGSPQGSCSADGTVGFPGAPCTGSLQAGLLASHEVLPPLPHPRTGRCAPQAPSVYVLGTDPSGLWGLTWAR